VKTVPAKVTYLQMRSPPTRPPPSAPIQAIRIARAEKPTVAFYRFLYDAVGRDWNWMDRKLTSDDELRQIIQDDRVEIHVLYVSGTPAGYAELDRRKPGDIELAYFGIMPEFAGKGLGRYLLDWALGRAWSYNPRRVWLHTCELDHPAALPMYRRAGFEVFGEVLIDHVVP